MRRKILFLLVVIIVISTLSCSQEATDSDNSSVDTTEESSIPSQPKPTSKRFTYERVIKGPIEQVILYFYQALAEKNCAKAIQLRPGYTEKRCLKLQNVDVKNIIKLRETTHISVVYLDISYQQDGKEKSFFGYVKLEKINEQWLIVNDSYAQKLDLKQYLKKHKIPAAVIPTVQPDTSPQKVKKTDLEKPIIPIEKGSSPIQMSCDFSFGSEAILESCWTEAELAGSPRDKKVRRPIKNPYRQPPRITTPYDFKPQVESRLRNSIRRVKPDQNKKIVALTFDLCERTKEKTGYDAAIVNYLRKHRVKATFYAGGKWMHSHPEKAMQLMADPQFEIGNHAWTHGNMRVLKGEEMENQILWTQGQYQVLRNQLLLKLENGQCPVPNTEMNKIPLIPLTFRFPYGTCNAKSLQALANYGLLAVQWDVVTADPSRKQSAKAIARTVLRNVKPGSIVIAHANGRGYNTAKALPLFIPELRKRGYQFVTVSELLNSGKVVTTETCYELKPGDNKRYDRLFGKGTE